jgi:hypothetical protein
MSYCSIWYATKVHKKLECMTSWCSRCLVNWSKTKIMKDRISGNIQIPCPSYDCNHPLSVGDLFIHLGPDKFEKVNELYTDHYISQTEDVRRWPNEEWNYAGTIELQRWGIPLNCPEWEFSWFEFDQMTIFQSTVKSLKESLSFKSEAFSYLNEVLTGTQWPRWGMVIWKDGGWNHMTWGKCHFEFWWDCLGYYPNYVHQENTFWPIRIFITIIAPLMLSVMHFDYNLWKFIPILGTIQGWIFYVAWWILGYLVVPNFYLYISLFEGLVIQEWISLWNRDWIDRSILFEFIKYAALSLFFPIAYGYSWYLFYINKELNFLTIAVKWEIIIVLAGLSIWLWICILYFLGILLLFVLKRIFRVQKMTYEAIPRTLTRIRQMVYWTKKEKRRFGIVKKLKKRKKN